ncbi:MAG: cytochrome P450 [Novosphingobium sp.]|nr:cytochrome P450 [Novosphingobium sp.]
MSGAKAGECPVIVTNSDAFYLDPDSVMPEGPRPAVARSEYGFEFLSYPVVRQAFRDKRMQPRDLAYFEALGASEIILEFIRDGNLNFMSPEKHDRIRPILVKAFTTSRVDSFRSEMRRIGNGLVDRFVADGEADLVGQFCHEYPISVISQFVGLPGENVPEIAAATMHLRMLGQKPFEPGMPVLEKALRYLYDHISQVVAERRAQRPRDDFLGALITLWDEDERLTEKELTWSISFMLLGGHDTTRYTLAGCLISILEAGLWEGLAADPAPIPDVIADSMRLHPGTPRQMRVVHEPLEVAGQSLVPGDVVSLNLSAAGRDPATFDDPATLHCPRNDPAYDIGFGFGRFACIGQTLARAEIAEAIGVLTQRLSQVEMIGEPSLKPTGVVAGYDCIPVRFKPREGRSHG